MAGDWEICEWLQHQDMLHKKNRNESHRCWQYEWQLGPDELEEGLCSSHCEQASRSMKSGNQANMNGTQANRTCGQVRSI